MRALKATGSFITSWRSRVLRASGVSSLVRGVQRRRSDAADDGVHCTLSELGGVFLSEGVSATSALGADATGVTSGAERLLLPGVGGVGETTSARDSCRPSIRVISESNRSASP